MHDEQEVLEAGAVLVVLSKLLSMRRGFDDCSE